MSTETETREQHMEWCKKRAREYCDRGDVSQAMASMGSDLAKHPETKNHPGIAIGIQLLMIGNLSSPFEMRQFIEGFH